LRDHTGCATTAGYGPRFLHSTGQLHKGGAPIGWFIQLTSDHPKDRPIPGWPYTFGHLIDAQAQGDFESIEAHDLPIVRVHLTDPDKDLAALEAAIAEALGGA
jgi:glucose-6-phosphate isomerase